MQNPTCTTAAVALAGLLTRDTVTDDATTDRPNALLDSVPMALVLLDAFHVRDVNSAFLRLTGHDATHGLVGRPTSELVVSDDRARLHSAIADCFAGRKVAPFDLGVLGADGSSLSVEATLSLVDDARGDRLALCFRDTSREKNLEARLAQTERAATLGMLVAGVAHEINNPLAYALGSLDIAVRRLDAVRGAELDAQESSSIRQCLDNARDGVERVRLIVRDLSNLSRPSAPGPSGVDLEGVLDSAVNLAWNELRHRARVIKHYAAVPSTAGDSARLGQVFLNLLVNAAQAIPDGAAMDAEIRLVTYVEGGSIVAEVHDTGSGMAPEVAARIFDPFFTTKAGGIGTGLGLSICREIVTSIGGSLEFATRPNVGSCFRVKLPPSSGIGRTQPTATVDDASPRGSGARVLVVDDEPLLGQTLRLALQGHHEVVVVSSGREALSHLEHDSAFDAILCDLMMPDVSGIAVYRAISERHPRLVDRFAFMTGGAFTNEAREFFVDYAGPRLEKPFDVRQVEELVARVSASS